MIGYAICGSFCTHATSLEMLRELATLGEDIVPFLSENVQKFDTKFGTAAQLRRSVREITGREPITDIVGAEPFGAATPLDFMIIASCTGNTLAKLANGITDSTVTMAAKAQLRCDRPLLIALSSNDAMSQNLKNIAALLTRKSVYFVPMLQDSPLGKPHSLVASGRHFLDAFYSMKRGEQLRPLFLL